MNIFVGGSLREVPLDEDRCRQFIQQLGERIVERKHTLLGGCRGSLDKAIAEAASRWLDTNALDKRRHLISYRLANDQPAHRLGRIQISQRGDWELGHPDLWPPEQIAQADVTVFVAGGDGTFSAANWARIADKPILGLAQFGGAGREIFEREKRRFKDRYSHMVEESDFDILNQDTDDVDQLASEVVTLCESVITSNSVFTIMPFTAEFREVYLSYSSVCEEFGFHTERTDESDSSERIIPRILAGIRRAAFVVADVTSISANVFYEIGFAEGMGRRVIVTAKTDTRLPFDIADIPVLFWNSQEELKEKLRKRVQEISPAIRRRAFLHSAP